MEKVAYLLKSSKPVYAVYYYFFSTILKIIGLFIRTDEKLILFNSYGGKKIDDSPKVIFEQMQKEERFKEYRLVWAVQKPEKFISIKNIEIIQSDTFQYFVYALRAKVWITNSSMERGLNFKKKNTICLNTWHGAAIKKMGIDIQQDNQSFRSKNNVCADIMLAQGQYDVDIFSHAFKLPKDKFHCIGLPRNDVLANYTKKQVELIKKKLGIDANKKVLLYAPTFRENTKGKNKEVVLRIPMKLDFWQEKLERKYVVLFRAHYEVAKHMEVNGFSVFMDVSEYTDLNELMIVSDALVSDYSSIYFDYSIMHKPMFCFAYDYEEYMSNRGMYLNLEKELPCKVHRREEDLLLDILSMNHSYAEKCSRTEDFQRKFVTEYGRAAKRSCDVLYEVLNK